MLQKQYLWTCRHFHSISENLKTERKQNNRFACPIKLHSGRVCNPTFTPLSQPRCPVSLTTSSPAISKPYRALGTRFGFFFPREFDDHAFVIRPIRRLPCTRTRKPCVFTVVDPNKYIKLYVVAVYVCVLVKRVVGTTGTRV